MKMYKKKEVRPGTMLYPLPAVMVTCGDMKHSNIITIAWTGIINSEPPMTYVSVKKSRQSHDIIEKTGEFTINLVSEDLTRALDYCGVKSGRDVDKWKETGLTREKASKVKAPLIKEAPVSLECKVVEMKELPSHDMFMAEIVSVHVDEEYIGKNGAYDFGDMGLVAYNHGKYHQLQKRRLGFFGFSVMKEKTRKRKRLPKRK